MRQKSDIVFSERSLPKVLAVLLLWAAVGMVFAVSGRYVDGTVIAKREYFTYFSLAACCVSVPLLFLNRRLRFSRTDLWMALFAGCTAVNHYLTGGEAETRFLFFLLSVALYFEGRIVFTCFPGAARWLLAGVLISGAVEAWIGLRQVYGLAVSHHSLFKTTGTLFNPGPYGGYLGIVFVMAVYVWLTGYRMQERLFARFRGSGNVRWLMNRRTGMFVLAVMTAILTGIMLPATMSRSAWLAVLLAGGTMAAIETGAVGRLKNYCKAVRGRAVGWIAIALLVSGCVGFGLYAVKKDSANGRLLAWKTTAAIIAEHPLTGAGFGKFGGAYAEAQARYFAAEDRSSWEIRTAGSPEYGFNEYLQLGAETGLIGLGLFLAMVVSAFGGLKRKNTRPLAYGLAALLVFALSSYPFRVLPLCVLLVLFLAAGGEEKAMLGHIGSKIVYGLLLAGTLALNVGTVGSMREKYKAYDRWNGVQMLYRMQLYEEVAGDYAALYPQLKDEGKFLFEYGHTLNKTGDYRESDRVLKKGVRFSADPMFWNVMGNNGRATGDFERAEACYLKARHIVPNRLYPIYLLMNLERERGNRPAAEKWARKLCAQAPKVDSPAVREMKNEARKLLEETGGTDDRP